MGGFIVQMKSPDKGVNPAMLHGALTQLVTGVLLVGIASAGLVPGEEVDHAKIAVKLVIVLIITALAFITLLAFTPYPLPWFEGRTLEVHPLLQLGMWSSIVSMTAFAAFYAYRVSQEASLLADALTATELILQREKHLHQLDGLAAAAAHELGTPLATISVVAKEMERDLGHDERYREDVQLLRSQGHEVTHVDLGGGLGVRYRDGDNPPEPADYGAMVARVTKDWGVRLMFEPGRVIAGNAGILLTRVIRVKPGAGNAPFVIVDAAMNDLARPAMYDAFHGIMPIAEPTPGCSTIDYDVVGPVCESGDWLGRDRQLSVQPGDVLAVLSAGAYGMTMASNYNTRGRAAEVMVDGSQAWVIREREVPADLFKHEHLLPN